MHWRRPGRCQWSLSEKFDNWNYPERVLHGKVKEKTGQSRLQTTWA